jgi:hypothetical protein
MINKFLQTGFVSIACGCGFSKSFDILKSQGRVGRVQSTASLVASSAAGDDQVEEVQGLDLASSKLYYFPLRCHFHTNAALKVQMFAPTFSQSVCHLEAKASLKVYLSIVLSCQPLPLPSLVEPSALRCSKGLHMEARHLQKKEKLEFRAKISVHEKLINFLSHLFNTCEFIFFLSVIFIPKRPWGFRQRKD